MTEDLIAVEVLKDVISKMSVKDYYNQTQNLVIHYEPGRSIQILKSLSDINNSITEKGIKYPLIAALMPIREVVGGAFTVVTFPRIVIAVLTKTGTSSENVMEKYSSDGTFKTVLYPCYNELMSQFAKSKYINGSDWTTFKHTKMDNPCQQPIGEGLNDYVDSIEILNLELKFNQIKTC